MKYRIFILIICLFLSTYISVISYETNSKMVNVVDSLSKINNDSVNEGFDLIAIGGLGMTTGSTWGFWENDFSIGPALALGLEIPFSKSHHFAFQLYGHTWISKNRKGYLPNKYRDVYIEISNNFYSQIGLSALLKYYLGNVSSKFRVSFHLGYLFLSLNSEHTGIDFGFSFYYSINKNWAISISRRLNFGQPDFGGNSKDVPNLLMLNVCYKFKLVI